MAACAVVNADEMQSPTQHQPNSSSAVPAENRKTNEEVTSVEATSACNVQPSAETASELPLRKIQDIVDQETDTLHQNRAKYENEIVGSSENDRPASRHSSSAGAFISFNRTNCKQAKIESPDGYHFLFIYAPGWHTQVVKQHTDATGKKKMEYKLLKLDEDRRKREQEINQFCKTTFPEAHYDTKKKERIQKRAEVEYAYQIDQNISHFFLNETYKPSASGAVHAVIVFIGHGSKSGFCVRSGENVNLGKIIEHVSDCWEKSRASASVGQLPKMVEIIFAQCYGHVFDRRLTVSCDPLKIVYLTSERYVTTMSKANENGEYYIVELEPVAKRIAIEIAEYEKMVADAAQAKAEAGVNDVDSGNQDEKQTADRVAGKPNDNRKRGDERPGKGHCIVS